MITTMVWPMKPRDLHNHHVDSTIWNEFRFRLDDLIIATYAKSGTTWMPQIIAQMLVGPDPALEVAEMSPWLDLRVPPKAVKLPVVAAQTHRRFLKTHLPVDALVFYPGRNASISGETDAMWCGVCIPIMPTRTPNGTRRSTTPLDGSGLPSRRLPVTSASTGRSGWRTMATPSGHCGRISAPGGRFASCRMSCGGTLRT
jgi:hypothetical protein